MRRGSAFYLRDLEDKKINAVRAECLTTIANNGVKYCIPLHLDKYLGFLYVLWLGYNYY